MWLATTLSALLFNLAFFFPYQAGFLILFFWIPLVRIGPSFKAGFYWGLIALGAHFTWLLQVLLQHSHAAGLVCVGLYGFLVGYGALIVGVLFGLVGGWALPLYFLYLQYLFLWPLGLGEGYPFLNPLIPLALMVGLSEGGQIPKNIAYVAPVVNKIKNAHAPWRHNPWGVGQKIFHQLYKVAAQHPQATVFVTPESMFCFPLNDYPELISLWTSALPTNTQLLMGSIYQKGDCSWQAVFWLHGRLIINLYVKKTVVPLVETIPKYLKGIKMFLNLFLQEDKGFSCHVPADAVGAFEFENRCWLPQLCSEFFMSTVKIDRDQTSELPLICLMINDSWFNSFFKQILQGMVRLKVASLGVPVLMVGHEGMTFYERKKR
jgi:hypothetical protein